MKKYSACVFVDTWLNPEGFTKVDYATPGNPILPRFVMNMGNGVFPSDLVIQQALSGFAGAYGVKEFEAISLEIPQGHLFDKTQEEKFGTYIWLKWAEDKMRKNPNPGKRERRKARESRRKVSAVKR